MNVGWIVLAVAIAVAVGILTTAWFRRDADLDLGNVSHQWIAEQKGGRGHDPQR